MKWLAWSLLLAALLLAGGYAFTTLQFTVIADFREAILGSTPDDPLVYGATLYRTRGCSGCHEAHDPLAPPVIGPNLSDIAARADANFLRRSMLAPDEAISGACSSSACPAGVMPAYGEILSPQQIDALIAYLLTLTAPGVAAPLGPP